MLRAKPNESEWSPVNKADLLDMIEDAGGVMVPLHPDLSTNIQMRFIRVSKFIVTTLVRTHDTAGTPFGYQWKGKLLYILPYGVS